MSRAPAAADAGSLLRTVRRLEEAEQLRSAMALYCHAVDLRATDVLNDLFAPDAASARTSAYFLHTHPGKMSGGLYEGAWTLSPRGAWQIQRWQVTLGWEKAFKEPGYVFSDSLSAHSGGQGLPVAWTGSGMGG